MDGTSEYARKLLDDLSNYNLFSFVMCSFFAVGKKLIKNKQVVLLSGK